MIAMLMTLLRVRLPVWVVLACLVGMVLMLMDARHHTLRARADAAQHQARADRAERDLLDLKARAATVVAQQIHAAMLRERELQADIERASNALQNHRTAAAVERVRTEQRLRDSAARYAATDRADDTQDAGAACRSDAPAGARLSEATRSDLIGLAVDADALAVTLGQCQRLLATCTRISSP